MDTHLKHAKGKEISQMKAHKDMHTQLSPLKTDQARDMLLKRTEEINSRQQATVIVFDIETNGFSQTSRIIEFAAQDLAGGEFSTFQSLVNPEGAPILNDHIHHISSYMVNRPDVPRWKDLAPILIQYVRSRQKAGGPVIWVAHNNWTFDARFIARECNRCSLQLPSDWLFVDTLPLAREVMQLNGTKKASTKLACLREYYKIPSMGPEHRAMADCNVLALVLQKLSFDLKLTVSDLIGKAFEISDIPLDSISPKS
ncbi:hypothetical protein SUGI_0531080 [Cryptomeria japonica]|nr:hypothetical protein SUGI_0531080 [Cryptomeria japonica]